MILVEVTAAVAFGGVLKTFYFSTDPFVSSPSDAPANQVFDPVLIDPGSFGLYTFQDGQTGGGTQLQTGEIVLANVDGEYDALKDYSFDGRTVVVRMGDPTAGYPAGLTTVFTGTVESVDVGWTQAVIRVKPPEYLFQVPALPNSYAGTNALPNGIEGTANDLKGQKKPRVYGKVYNIGPPCVNTSLLIFQASDRALQTVDAVYDRGAALTPGADYATNALLQAATGLAASSYITCKAEGLIRLASSPAGVITCDVTQGANAAARTAAQILKQMATDAGATTYTPDVTAMDAIQASELGIWVTDGQVFGDAMDQIAKSVGAAYFFDSTSQLRLGLLAVPSGSPALSLAEYQILDIERVQAPAISVPPWAIIIRHTRNYTQQTTDLAGAVTIATRAFLADELRATRSEDTLIKTKYLLAGELTRDTLIADKTNASNGPAATEAARVLALLKSAPNMYQVAVPLDTILGTSMPILSVVSLTLSRFGMQAGKLLLLTGVDLELASNKAVLTLWG